MCGCCAAGNLVLLEGIDATITKTATVVPDQTDYDVHIFRPLQFQTQSVMKIATEPLNPSELPKMVRFALPVALCSHCPGAIHCRSRCWGASEPMHLNCVGCRQKLPPFVMATAGRLDALLLYVGIRGHSRLQC